MTGFELFGIVLASVLIGNLLVTLVTSFLMKPPAQQIIPPSGLLGQIFNDLNLLIDLEFVCIIETPNHMRDTRIISDFKKAQEELTRNVLESLSTAFFARCNLAGVKKAYVITYVTRKATMKIFDYMNRTNMAMKGVKPKNDK